jgi:glycogen synthase
MNPIALVAYESRYARCGGVTAVLNHLPGHLQAASGATTVVITPYHLHSRDTAKLDARVVGEVRVPFAGYEFAVAVRRHDDRWPWCFLDASAFTLPAELRLYKDDRHFFAGKRHPYDVGRDGGEQLAILRRDALLFGVAAARALSVIQPGAVWSLLLQDWQAATTALALAGQSTKHQLVLTLHNSYDSGGVFPGDLAAVGIDAGLVAGADGAEGSTVLNRAWPLVRKPLVTVSEQFALDLTEDPFQRHIMADQLQAILAPPNLIGINNGPFAALAVPADRLEAAQRGVYAPLAEWKEERKRQAMAALRGFTPTAERVVWGDVTAFLRRTEGNQPAWFVLAGRDDPRQKGYDIAAAAIAEFLADERYAEAAQFLFFPIPGDEDRAGLAFLRELATRHPANVLALPFIFAEGYQAALQGAAFGVMPSLYEPFGMANEFYFNGAVGIGRATGGLVQQIVPQRGAASFNAAVARLAERWHPVDAEATGFLFREPDGVPNVVADWRRLSLMSYRLEGPDNRVVVRLQVPLYRTLVGELRKALADAVAVYRATPGREHLCRLLTAGIEHTQRGFSWQRTAAAYVELLRHDDRAGGH